jgi:putative Mg2+ transporter-C (MgtC) family protein
MSLDDLTAFLAGQGWVQVGELVLAFVLSSLIGLERQLHGKSAGMRTQAIVGTASALMLLISKYGFSDVLVAGHVVLDPSRVAAQIVTGVGFLGAGLILTRRGAVRGLTTAASVWETAAIGMAAGAGLWLLALVVTALHFIVVFGYTALIRLLPGHRVGTATIEIGYSEARGLLRVIVAEITAGGWRIERLTQLDSEPSRAVVRIVLSGTADAAHLISTIGLIDGVSSVTPVAPDDEFE